MKQTIILISGKQGSGKTSLAKHIAEKVNIVMNEANIKARHYSFADAIYKLQNVCLDQLRLMGMEVNEKEGELLQSIGAWGRRRFGADCWVNIVKKAMEKDAKYIVHANGLISIVSDTRFPNELLAFTNPISVRLECPEEIRKARILATPGQNWRENTNHESEISLDGRTDWTYVFETYKVSVENCANQVLAMAGEKLV